MNYFGLNFANKEYKGKTRKEEKIKKYLEKINEKPDDRTNILVSPDVTIKPIETLF